ncbi:bis 5'-nucleosyl-tetraphosphatase [Buchnera aphidicola str. Bp (Baizongia pistaciae)]|uniref:Bis(5'-nucleosyl)-tetraphosphatase, symmetrical n=1 Tax=Buchnera aphidicola subsp. Baizongia pistaciae (strain Bp) TaxID=224915 RepID=APAH_BUCBP|nr:symmetrical bis(5'-nucleosyl)-tetraphosphatase [Buchnera aphidicola]Q89AV3.1 RecName: Full=Bis(5'-nucleosyl)-tetraphosphatase, symmetrical; AltName: Full=Ap4A hydrolase; AltName: Full=Diadenosine 5',5'''-P1,P4-tetraphosphate pyrophosphohydrolase; AltName: Full=Diadenosine tetraphosphatase [Buchnera aphidicola str. Bp (Baizongia pistaciae)]AAO26866.1 bis 5'-nucleosyl-tetraphosphatase [Buchnera aphidicola str. Bp (Baizongia pistaciae)]
MSTYFIGDIHGCFNELMHLLEKVSFDANSDVLWLTGDLINRGPKSLEVLRFVSSLGDNVKMVLGNHDVNLIALYASIKNSKKSSLMNNLLKSHDIDYLIYWLRKQPLFRVDHKKKIIMSHAGMYPYWDIQTASCYAKKIESMLCNHNYDTFLDFLYNNSDIKSKLYECTVFKNRELECLKLALNVFTRMRYCLPNGELDMTCKQSPSKNISSLLPWFFIKNSCLEDYCVFFGHWASLEKNITPKNIISLDTGCCWGGILSMFRLEDKKWFVQESEIKK